MVFEKIWMSRGHSLTFVRTKGALAPKTTHYLFTFSGGTFLPFQGSGSGREKRAGWLLPQPNSSHPGQEDVGSASLSVAHTTVLPRKRLLVSGSTSVFSIPVHLVGPSVSPAFVASDKRSQSASAALKWPLMAPGRVRPQPAGAA